MTRVKVTDLPPRVREQVLKGMDKPRKRTSQLVGPHDGTGRWACHACGEFCVSWAAVTRHMEAAQHNRFDQVIGGT